jgi:hypothetical protein
VVVDVVVDTGAVGGAGFGAALVHATTTLAVRRTTNLLIRRVIAHSSG